MDFCTWEDIANRFDWFEYKAGGHLPVDSYLTLGAPWREHAMEGWRSIGIQGPELARHLVLAGFGDPSGYLPLWDVYVKDEEYIRGQLKLAGEHISMKVL